MASYHLEAQIIGRSDGRSAIHAAAYRSGGVLTCPETGEVSDYSRKAGIVETAILTPPDAPAWAQDRQALWSAVHAKEARKNSQLARELTLALPHELDAAARSELVRAWVAEQLVARGMVADIAIHDPAPRAGKPRNPHAHIMLTMRPLDASQPDGWSRHKGRDWNGDDVLAEWRESWAEAQNATLEAGGHAARVDHRTLEAQRIDAEAAGDEIGALVLSRDPEPRLGVAAGGMEARGHHTERGEALRAAREHRAALHQLADEVRAADEAARAAADHVATIIAFRTALTAPAPEEEAMPQPHDRTRTAIERQLRGMGLPALEVSITGIDRPSVQTMTPAEILADLPRLKRLNKSGAHVYVRAPRDRDHDMILLDDLSLMTPERMAADGVRPAVVVETSPGSYQAWVRLGEPVPADVRSEIARTLAARYGGDTAAADAHQSGRLAGLTNQKPRHRRGGLAPFVLLHSYAGRVAEAARALIETARAALATRREAQAVEVTPAPDADADLVAWWRDGHAVAPSGRDLSSVDWHLTHLALASGCPAEDVVAALEAVSDRKGSHAANYAVQTVTKAVTARADYAPPSDDSPSPF